jgi:hypothetical protein
MTIAKIRCNIPKKQVDALKNENLFLSDSMETTMFDTLFRLNQSNEAIYKEDIPIYTYRIY